MVEPVRLDPFQIIREVGWGGGRMLAIFIEWEFSSPNNYPLPLFIEFPSIGGAQRMGSVIQDVGPQATPPKKYTDDFQYRYAPRINDSTIVETSTFTFVNRAKCEVEYSVGIIHSLVDPLFGTIVPFVAEYRIPPVPPLDEEDGLNVLTYENLGPGDLYAEYLFPFLGGLPPGENYRELHIEILSQEVVTQTYTTYIQTGHVIFFVNLDKVRAAFQKSYGNTAPFFFHVRRGGGTSRENRELTVSVSTFKGESRFPIDENGFPAFSDTHLRDFLQFEYPNSPESSKPLKDVRFDVDFNTLLIQEVEL
jgi:hypothetical protein